MKTPILVFCLLLPLALGLSLQEDDLVFDDVGEDVAVVTTASHHQAENRRTDVHDSKPWRKKQQFADKSRSSSNTVVEVGHVFKRRISKDNFPGIDDYFELVIANRQKIPAWLHWDEQSFTLLGVPSKKDVGSVRVDIEAVPKQGKLGKDSLAIKVVTEKQADGKRKDAKARCDDGEDNTFLSIVLDAKFDGLTPLTKVDAIENLAGFLGLHASALSIFAQTTKDISNPDTSVVLTGPGNVKHRKEKHWTAVQWQVGCDGHIWKHQRDIVKQLREQAKDGTLAEVLQLPVLFWRVKTDSGAFLRNRREAGSGDYGNEDDYDTYDNYDEDYEEGDEEGDDDNESITKPPIQSYVPNVSRSKEIDKHPHRHHHGEENIDFDVDEEVNAHNIVPVVDRNALESTANLPTDVIPRTTTEITSTSPPTTTTSTTTTTTTTMPTTSTNPPTTTTPVVPTVVSTTLTTSSTAETTAYVTVPSTAEPPRAESTEGYTEKTRHMETESESTLTTIPPPDFTTILPPATTVHSRTAVDAAVTMAGRTETDVAATVSLNLTTEESSDASTTKQPTTFYVTAGSTLLNLGTSTYVPTYAAVTNSTTLAPTTTSMRPSPNVTSTAPTVTTYVPTANITTTTMPTTTTTVVTTTMPTTTTTRTTYTTTTTTPAPTTTTAQATRIPTETVGIRNYPPRQHKRLQKLPVTAGKPLSYIIPADTFSDFEDGDTRKLTLNLYLQGEPLKNDHWLQFNPQTQEIYGLPLEDDVSTWNYDLVATDSEGLNVYDKLLIYVQQHKLSRSVNHEFSLYLKIDKRGEFHTDVDWELKVIRNLAELYGDMDAHHITVRSIDVDGDQAIFTWTNDTVPRGSECPKEYINRLLRVLVTDKGERPNPALRKLLAPEMRVDRVVYQGIAQCEDLVRPELPKVPTQVPKINLPPVPRNQVDRINATVGQLLVFTVPEDTFFDSEDGSSRKMKMSLLTVDRKSIPEHEWLQFDSNNQEFYGIPMRKDIGRKEYQLVVTDSHGASATDGLVVVVHPAPPMQHTVEFSMTLDIPYNSFANSAYQKRNFIEKLRDLYGDRDTSAISLSSITEGSTVVTWHNVTLPTAYCAHEEINRLRSVLVKSEDDRRSVMDEVAEFMGQKFPVTQITVIPMGICLGELTGIHSPDSHVPPVDDSTSVGTFHDEYLITFVLPAIIIAAMLILAGIIACVLYRRRRSGKMSVSEHDDERQSFRSKGIPVIFQDELDEKPDPGNKSPVILKEEKPPLPPPEYQKAEDGADVPMLPKENSEEPYQPPPPFATNRDTNRQNRPKPTPTYRKPPPYVPP